MVLGEGDALFTLPKFNFAVGSLSITIGEGVICAIELGIGTLDFFARDWKNDQPITIIKITTTMPTIVGP